MAEIYTDDPDGRITFTVDVFDNPDDADIDAELIEADDLLAQELAVVIAEKARATFSSVQAAQEGDIDTQQAELAVILLANAEINRIAARRANIATATTIRVEISDHRAESGGAVITEAATYAALVALGGIAGEVGYATEPQLYYFYDAARGWGPIATASHHGLGDSKQFGGLTETLTLGSFTVDP